jgi:hypothetical protein
MIEFLDIKCDLYSTGFHSNFTFHEFSLKELGLPSADELLEAVLKTKNEVGVEGWRKNQNESDFYKGFSLTYNPNFIDTQRSLYFQTFGSYELIQTFSKSIGDFAFSKIRDSYYDTYAFSHITPVIERNFKNLLSRFALSISRSRVSFLYGSQAFKNNINFHKDEFPRQLLRINIPLQTSQEYLLEINGEDEAGAKLKMTQHLQIGKAYIWNTRIPHRVYCSSPEPEEPERIHLVLGLIPWFDYCDSNKALKPNTFYKKEIKRMIDDLNFLVV